MKEELKTLKVFSKKMDKIIDVLSTDNKLTPLVEGAWVNNGWNNFIGPTWQNNGWNNFIGDSWINNGWNNFIGPTWRNNGWNNFIGDSWTNNGWNNFYPGWSNNSSSDGCFITTAAVSHMHLADDCEELTILRKYRDQLINEDPEFKKIVLEYYKVAPQIVDEINKDDNKNQILDNIYNELVVPVTNYLKDGQIKEAKEHYISIYNKLKEKYILNK